MASADEVNVNIANEVAVPVEATASMESSQPRMSGQMSRQMSWFHSSSLDTMKKPRQPWSVKKDFKTKVFALALLEHVLVFGSTVLLDHGMSPRFATKARQCMYAFGCIAFVSLAACAWNIRKYPVNYIFLIFITGSAGIFWPMADVGFFADWANVPAQLLGTMTMVCLVSLLVAQIPPTICSKRKSTENTVIREHRAEDVMERTLYFGGTLLGWVFGTILCGLVTYNVYKSDCRENKVSTETWDCAASFATDTRVSSVITSAFIALMSVFMFTLCAGPQILRCDPDDYMVSCLVMTTCLYSLLAFPLLCFGMGVVEGAIFCSGGSTKSQKMGEEEKEQSVREDVKDILAQSDNQRTVRPPVATVGQGSAEATAA